MASLVWIEATHLPPIELDTRPLLLGGTRGGFPEHFPEVAEIYWSRSGGHRIRSLTKDVSTLVAGQILRAGEKEGHPLVDGAEIRIGGFGLRYRGGDGARPAVNAHSTVHERDSLPTSRFQIFCRLAEALGVQIDLELGLDAALRCLLDLFPRADRAALYLETQPDDAAWLATPRFHRRRQESVRPGLFSRRLARRLLEKHSPPVIQLREGGDEPDACGAGSVASSWLLAARLMPETWGGAVPLQGIISLEGDPASADPPFTDEDTGLLEAAALLLAGFLQRVSLHRAAAELAIAREIRTLALPSRVPPIPRHSLFARFMPAAQVNGDFYDVVSHDGGVQVLVGEVSGKSVPAALLMAQILATFRAHAGTRGATGALGAVDHMLSLQDGAPFATAILADFDPQGKTTLRVYGHPTPFVRRGGSWNELDLEPGAPPLGTGRAGGPVSGSAIELAPGDALLFTTDGLTEARSLDTAGAAEILAGAPADPAGLLEHVAGQVLRHSHGSLARDLTLILLVRDS